MRRQSLSSWNENADLEGLQFWVQRLDELLFQYTYAPYRAPVLGTRQQILECSALVREVLAGEVRRESLEPCLKELSSSLGQDSVAESIIGPALGPIAKSLGGNQLGLQAVGDRLRFLSKQLTLKAYYEELQRQLSIAIDDPSQKERLDRLTALLAATLVAGGYAPQHTIVKMQNYFHKLKRITSSSEATRFLSEFDFESREYEVQFRVCATFTQVWNVVRAVMRSDWDVELVSVPTDQHVDSRHASFCNAAVRGERLLKVQGVKAVCSNHAAESVRRALSFAADAVRFAHHSTELEWSEQSCVIQPDGDRSVVTGRDPSAMLRRRDTTREEAVDRLARLFSMRILPESSIRLSRVFDMHDLALETTEPANQLLDLWSTLEILVPASPDGGTSIIGRVHELISVCGQYTYASEHFRSFDEDCRNWNETVYESVLSRTPSPTESRLAKVASLVCAEEATAQRDELVAAMDDFVLLRYRFFRLNQTFRTPKDFAKSIAGATQYASWQLSRIYRTRNYIVHTGRTPAGTSALVVLLHDMVDMALSVIVGGLLADESATAIEDSIVAAGAVLQVQQERLKQFDRFEAENLEGLLYPDGIVVGW